MKNWYVINTKPKQEKLAGATLVREGIEVFLPQLQRSRFVRSKVRNVTESLFPNYLFARFDPIKNCQLVRYCKGVKCVIGNNGTFWKLDEQIIVDLKARQGEDGYVQLSQGMDKGDHVEILQGPMIGLEGIFEKEIKPAERVMILLNFLGNQSRLEINPAFLRLKS